VEKIVQALRLEIGLPAESKENNMNNLKKPIFWALATPIIYIIITSVVRAAMSPNTTLRLLSVITIVIGIVGVFILAHIPIQNLSLLRLTVLLIGVLWIFGGGVVTASVLQVFSMGGYPNAYSELLGINAAGLLPMGLLMIIFWTLDRISNQKKSTAQKGPSISSR